MSVPEIVCLDFETTAIDLRPAYPPVPVGVSIQLPGERKPRYLAWGHPSENNCSKTDARALLKQVWNSRLPLLFHNGKFDLDVAEVHLGLKLPAWQRCHDTMFLLFLTDPHAPSLALKPASHRLLGIRPTEQEDLETWIINNIPEAKKKKSEWGRYICRAPGGIVGRYAEGDVMRTLKMFQHCYRHCEKHDMLEAYNREQRLMPHLLASERTGLRIDRSRLDRDIPVYEAARDRAAQWLFKRIGKGEFNLDSNDELGEMLLRARLAKEENFLRTSPSKNFPEGQLSMGKESLSGAVKNPQLLSALGYYSRMQTCLGTFMNPWLEKSAASGMVYPKWHQVRTGKGDSGSQGARSGRIICTDPNLLNLSKDFEDKDDGYKHPDFITGLPPLPLVRVYILPDRGQIFAHRDYNQQEFRILAHFEDGSLCRQYNENPKLDVHELVRQEIHRIRGMLIERRAVKIQNFGMLYGQGLGKTAIKMKITVDKAKELSRAHKDAMPDVAELNDDIKRLFKEGKCIRTWGGREYYCEEPRIIDGRAQTYEYKGLNYLMQGSAADATKEAVIRYHEHPDRREGRFLVTVYDELNASLPTDKTAQRREMNALLESMEGLTFGVPMLSDAKIGRSWGELKKYVDVREKA